MEEAVCLKFRCWKVVKSRVHERQKMSERHVSKSDLRVGYS